MLRDKIVVFMTSLVVVVLFSQPVWAAGLRETLEDFIVEHYPWSDIEIISIRAYGTIPSSVPDEITVERGPIGKAVFALRYGDSTVKVRAYVVAYVNVVKSKRPFRKNHVIVPDDIYLERVDVRRIPGGAIETPERVSGKVLKRSIAANVVITEEMIQNSREVKRGRPVTLILRYRGMTITAKGKLKERAYVGSIARAINLSSNREVTGVLVDENTVEVRL